MKKNIYMSECISIENWLIEKKKNFFMYVIVIEEKSTKNLSHIETDPNC